MKSMNKHIGYALIALVLLGFAGAFAAAPKVSIIWPKKEAAIGAVDSTFIFGSVTPGASLTINDLAVDVHPDGGFLAFMAINPGRFEFKVRAIIGAETTSVIWPVQVPVPRYSLPYDSLVIIDRNEYSGNLVLLENDRLIVRFQGTPGCRAYFSVPGFKDTVRMAEMPPQLQPFWGETVFGAGAVPDSMKIRGFYQGYATIDKTVLADSVKIYYYLKTPRIVDFIKSIKETGDSAFDYKSLDLLNLTRTSCFDSSSFYIRLNPGGYPCMVEFTDSMQIMRVGPQKGYLSIFQPRGIKALAVGRDGDWVRLKLSQYQTGWVNVNSVRFLNPSLPPIESYIKAIRAKSTNRSLDFEIPLSGQHPFRVEEESPNEISLYLFGVTSDTDWIRYDFSDKNLIQAIWTQPEPGLYKLRLCFDKPIWGFDAFYIGNVLKWSIINTPQDIGNIKNKVIVIDPGHSPDAGAVGPTGLKESIANLKIALELKAQLEKKGAHVIMTRGDMSPVALNDRPLIAVTNKADAFISIHNNALPDGINPFVNNGVSTYYYHTHSLSLARYVQEALLHETKMPDYGLYYGNLAVSRPTQYPAILVECAFMMIPEHEALLKGDDYPQKVAKAICNGIEKFFKNYAKDN
mgnify:CR=1 FL=1